MVQQKRFFADCFKKREKKTKKKTDDKVKPLNMGWVIKFAIVTPLLLLQIVFIIFQLQGSTDWNWAAVFTPLWIVDALIFLSIVAWTIAKLNEEKRRMPTLTLLSAYVAWGGLIAFEILMALEIQGSLKTSWSIVFIPAWIIDGAFLVGMAAWNKSERSRKPPQQQKPIPTWLFVVFILFAILNIFLALQLQGTIAWDWGLVFLPLWAIDFLFMVVIIIWIYERVKQNRPRYFFLCFFFSQNSFYFVFFWLTKKNT